LNQNKSNNTYITEHDQKPKLGVIIQIRNTGENKINVNQIRREYKQYGTTELVTKFLIQAIGLL
jgi:hypothetical protein